MYLPKSFREENLETLLAFMRANSFATLVSVLDGVPIASHVPLVVEEADGVVTLHGHLARQNPQCQALAAAESLAIFSGPHAYVSPTLYEKYESVPTWNYIAVHAYGQPQTLTLAESREAMDAMLATMISAYEPGYQGQWDALPEKFRDGMMHGIVGFRMVVTRLEGKYKLSQNRSLADQHNVAAALRQQHHDPAAVATGEVMRERLASDGS
ncbi:MAG: FMN-binding negative transcriptional regulator [Chloroflexaceae bacterium]|jgi:transcriptional regulator|nr:FMN-binding negative transcriptional regulator [Chloroflexaceae bacterium]